MIGKSEIPAASEESTRPTHSRGRLCHTASPATQTSETPVGDPGCATRVSGDTSIGRQTGKLRTQIIKRDPVQIARDEPAGKQLIIAADGHLSAGAVDVDDVERRACGHAQSLALAHGEVVDAFMPAEHAPIGGDELAGGVRELLALLVEIGVNKALVIAAGDKADLLRVRLFRQREPVLPRQFAHLRLAHLAQREAACG